MRSIITTIDIDASPAKAWEVLTHFANYPDWNPYLLSIQGNLAPGETLQVTLQPESGAARTFNRRVDSVIQGSEFSWRSKLLSPFFFQGHHLFKVIPRDTGGVRFENIEHFSGILIPLLWPLISAKIQSRFEAMNTAFKKVLSGATP